FLSSLLRSFGRSAPCCFGPVFLSASLPVLTSVLGQEFFARQMALWPGAHGSPWVLVRSVSTCLSFTIVANVDPGMKSFPMFGLVENYATARLREQCVEV